MTHLDTTRRILDLPAALSPDLLDEAVTCLTARYPALVQASPGHSMLDRPIHHLRLGQGSPTALYVSGQASNDTAASAVLTRFANEYAEQLSRRGRLYGVSIPYLATLRAIHLLPMLNPDGIAYALEGPPGDHPLFDRVVAMNRGSDDFSGWQANARGVDLRCNYAPGVEVFMRRRQSIPQEQATSGSAVGWCGESPESEPESSALGRLLRTLPDVALLLELRCGERRLIQPKGADRRTAALGRVLGRLADAPVITADGSELPDWAASLGVPGFILYCGTGEGVFELYAGVRELLFLAPTLLGQSGKSGK